MKTIKGVIVSITMGLALLVAFQPASHAATPMELFLQDPDFDHGGFVVIDDNQPGDTDPTVGSIAFLGNVGTAWMVDITASITYPVLGTTGSPQLDLSSFNASSSSGSATLDIGVSTLGYTLAPAGSILEVGGTAAGKFSVAAYSGSDYFDTTNYLGGLMFTSPGAFSGSANGAIPGSPNPYSLTIFADIEHKGAGGTSFNVNLTVPEPSVLLFLGTGLVGLTGVRRKFKA